MEDNSLLMIVLAFVLGCMCSQMMKQMCGGRLVEGFIFDLSSSNTKKAKGEYCVHPYDCISGLMCDLNNKCN
tara:strand:+ start:416 stop:631 length:216 start_codon:yes stop_codon:yes gene_type:complete